MEQATDKQIAFMKQLGIELIPGITKATAREMIQAKLEARDKQNGDMGAPVERPMDKPTNGAKEYHLSPEEVKCRALECAVEIKGKNHVFYKDAPLLEIANEFVEWIYGN